MRIAHLVLGFAMSLASARPLCAAPQPVSAAQPKLTIVTLGDSITKGARPGVKREQTFAALVQKAETNDGVTARVLNVGIGGERTDQALKRLQLIIDAHRPQIVTVMYGTNDSYVDRCKKASRLSLPTYRSNLERIVQSLRAAQIEPILMTEPRWARSAAKNGLGEHPNDRLEEYVAACREVAHQLDAPLVDHFAHWTKAERSGIDLGGWTTDGCHPNPRGHREIAATLLPVLRATMRRVTCQPVPFEVKLQIVLKHDDGKFLWFHPRVVVVPGLDDKKQPSVLMTLQQHLRVSDYYSGLYDAWTRDLGATWSKPEARPALAWVHEPDGVTVAVADVTPGWHGPTRKVLAVGARVRYSKKGRQLDDKARSHQTSYAVCDPKSQTWSKWKQLRMPPDEKFNFARSACAQWLVQPDGTVLLPFYLGPSVKKPRSVTVVQCSFDGKVLKYLKHGTELALNVDRGLVEPSLIRFHGRYYLTIRNDRKGYVAVSNDGLSYGAIQPWKFDDGKELGSYNTQQHWLAHSEGLFLVYTRRGAKNDHVFRHRAPLFIAQVNPKTLQVIRKTERILIPERGATLGNFGAAAITPHESWVTVAEGVWNDDARKRGAQGALFLARVIWK